MPLKITTKDSQATSTITNQLEVGFVKYDSSNVMNLVVRYFIKEKLPFRYVESDELRELMNGVEPRFKLSSCNILQRDCIKLYEEGKLKLKKFLSSKRVCITTDTWKYLQNLNYMVVTVGFIDYNWIMHKKIIKFGIISSHVDDDMERMLENTLMKCGIESLFTIIVDNASNNDAMIKYIQRRLKDKPYTILGCQFLHVRYIAHILNLVVNEGLKGMSDCVSNIRNAVKFIRSSLTRMTKFKSYIERKKITYIKMICLDIQTR
jgi:hypothetical protein